jgi:hypothetical protein
VAGSAVGADELRQAAVGRQSRTAIHRPAIDSVRRADLLRGADALEFPESTDGGIDAADVSGDRNESGGA